MNTEEYKPIKPCEPREIVIDKDGVYFLIISGAQDGTGQTSSYSALKIHALATEKAQKRSDLFVAMDNRVATALNFRYQSGYQYVISTEVDYKPAADFDAFLKLAPRPLKKLHEKGIFEDVVNAMISKLEDERDPSRKALPKRINLRKDKRSSSTMTPDLTLDQAVELNVISDQTQETLFGLLGHKIGSARLKEVFEKAGQAKQQESYQQRLFSVAERIMRDENMSLQEAQEREYLPDNCQSLVAQFNLPSSGLNDLLDHIHRMPKKNKRILKIIDQTREVLHEDATLLHDELQTAMKDARQTINKMYLDRHPIFANGQNMFPAG